MKRFLPFLSSLLTLMILLACAFPAAPDAAYAPESEAEDDFVVPTAREIALTVYVEDLGTTAEIPLEVYTAGAVRAEMPLSYAPEALKAQAIAARTYALQKSRLFGGEGCALHPEADVCTAPSCCQGYWPAEQPDAADIAAEATRGMVVTFRGHPIRAMYHACAGGHTEDAENVYSSAIAYLRGVPSPGEESYSQYSAAVTLTFFQLADAFRDFEDVEFTDALPLADQLEILSRSDSGRVSSIRVGLTALSGSEFRRALGLRSANFTMTFGEDSVRFATVGSGHGVGMSQTGADAMARSGADCAEILHWYYTDTELTDLAALLSV